MAGPGLIGPDVVVAGAARSGTSFLSALLATHPGIDPGAVKESNYFSREYDRGPAWYDGLYSARRPGLRRLDGSMSYTFTHFPEAIPRLAADAGDAVVVYAIRHPITRLVSHFQLHRDYFTNEPAETLGEALTFSDVYSGAERLRSLVAGVDRALRPRAAAPGALPGPQGRRARRRRARVRGGGARSRPARGARRRGRPPQRGRGLPPPARARRTSLRAPGRALPVAATHRGQRADPSPALGA